MAFSFNLRRFRAEAIRSRPRAPKFDPANVNRVALAELTPDIRTYLGRAGCVQAALGVIAARAMATAPSMRTKLDLAAATSASLSTLAALQKELDRNGFDAPAAMSEFSRQTDRFVAATDTSDWHETVLTVYIASGLLNDFFMRLAEGLPEDAARRVSVIVATSPSESPVTDALRDAVALSPALASRLALWGRRLVGDTLLLARAALTVPEITGPNEARLEPVLTEIIASHTRRMDALGLTA